LAAPKLGGILLRVAETLVYVAAADAVKLAPIPHITRVPGAPEGLLGVALHEGEILPVVSIGSERESMLVCTHGGALLGIVGGSVVGTGMFDTTPDGSTVRCGDETATELDIASLCAKTSPPSWGGRWLG
jgi:CheW-like protein